MLIEEGTTDKNFEGFSKSRVNKRNHANQACTEASAMRRRRSGTYDGEMDGAGEKASEGTTEQGFSSFCFSKMSMQIAWPWRASLFFSNGYCSDALRYTRLTPEAVIACSSLL